MTTKVIPDQSTAFGERVHRRLTEEQVIWLTTVGRDGTPQPNPVWFLWQGDDSIVIYNRTTAYRLAHIRRQPRVSLHLDGDGRGGDIIVLAGPRSSSTAIHRSPTTPHIATSTARGWSGSAVAPKHSPRSTRFRSASTSPTPAASDPGAGPVRRGRDRTAPPVVRAPNG